MNRRLFLASAFSISLGVLLAGCGGGGSNAPVVTPPVGLGIRAATGGTLTSVGITLVVPAAALAADTNIVVNPATLGLPTSTPANTVVVPSTALFRTRPVFMPFGK